MLFAESHLKDRRFVSNRSIVMNAFKVMRRRVTRHNGI